jgi:hypothetical protein
VCLVLAVAGVIGTSCRHDDFPIARLLAPQRLAPPPPGALQYLEQMAKASRFSGKLVVNAMPAKADQLAVFLLDRGLDWERLLRQHPELIDLKDNCCALRDEATISCDARFLEAFIPKQDEYPMSDASQRALVRWVLGHELGHLVLGQGGLHFTPLEQRQRSLRNLAVQRREYAADCWMFRRFLEVSAAQDVTEVESLAIDLINTRLRQAAGPPPAGVGILYDYNRLDPYDFRIDAPHPDLLHRSARLLHVATTVRADPALDAMVSRFVARLVPDPLWKDRGPCSGSD